MNSRRGFGAALLAAAAGTWANGVEAQTVWTNPGGRASVELELLHPNFSDEIDFGFPSSAGFLTARVPLTGGLSLAADLPFSRAGWEDDIEGSSSSSLVGNPYLGIEWKRSDRFTTELGVRIPTGDTEDVEKLAPILVGTAGELDRMEAFVPEVLGVYAMANFRTPLGSQGFSARFRGGPAFLGGDGGPDDVVVSYTGQLWYGVDRLNLGTGVTGRANVTTDDEEVDRTSHQVALAGDYALGQFRPGLQVRLPLDKDVRDFTGSTVSLSLGYAFR